MKQTLLTLCLLLAFGTTKAQNDATWEETIAFIEKYKGFLIYADFANDQEISNFNISDSTLKFNSCDVKWFPDLHYKVVADLSKLFKVKYSEYDNEVLDIYFTGENRHLFYLSDGHSNEDDRMRIKVTDKEMRERMFNAFSHLAKLAKEKREADRKASDDKF